MMNAASPNFDSIVERNGVANEPFTWIQAYSLLSGKDMDYSAIVRRIKEIPFEDEDNMNATVNDPLMTPVTTFERDLFELLDPESGELQDVDTAPSFIEFLKMDHSFVEKMLLLVVISNFHKARIIRRLYKCGLLEVLQLWLAEPSDDSLIEVTLDFLLNLWTTKALITSYSFDIGKAILKVKKSGSESNRLLADRVQQHWTDILNTEEPKEEIQQESSTGQIRLPNSIAVPSQTEYVSSLPPDSVAHNTRSRRPFISEEELDYRKRLRMSSSIQPDSIPLDSPERKKKLWNLRIKRVDKRSKFNVKRHQSNYRCNIKLTIRMNYIEDIASIETKRDDVLSADGSYTLPCNPFFLDYVALYAGGFTKNLGHYTQVEIPNLESLDESIRGKIVRTRDIIKALNYLDTGYCGKVIKSY